MTCYGSRYFLEATICLGILWSIPGGYGRSNLDQRRRRYDSVKSTPRGVILFMREARNAVRTAGLFYWLFHHALINYSGRIA